MATSKQKEHSKTYDTYHTWLNHKILNMNMGTKYMLRYNEMHSLITELDFVLSIKIFFDLWNGICSEILTGALLKDFFAWNKLPYKIMHELPWITIGLGSSAAHDWANLPMIFTCDDTKWRSPEHLNPLKTIIYRSFLHGRSFLTKYCDVTTVVLWRHANASY